MPESRDRLSRPEEVTAIFARRRRDIRALDIYSDVAAGESFSLTPFRWGATPMTGIQGPVGVAAPIGRGVGRGIFGTQRNAIRHGLENVRPGGIRRGRGRGTILPSWYPRAPLRDITAVTRAIERRRERLREAEGLQLQTPTPPQSQIVQEPYAEFTPKVQTKQTIMKSSDYAAAKKCPPSVAKILRNITNQKIEGESSDSLTPQRKLLNSIDVVGKAVMEELEKMKKTPSAKRAIREKKIKTLMSMR